MIKNRKTALTIIFIFYFLGILIRLPNLNRPLSDHNEYVAANALMCIIAWADGGGAGKFNFVPIASYQNGGDKVYTGSISDSSGNVLYITFGPGWCVLPYCITKVFHITPSPLFLQLLNLFLHFVSCLIFFEIVCILFNKLYPDNYLPHAISFIALFCAVYCDWIGVFIGCSFGAVLLFQTRKNKKYFIPTLTSFFAIFASLCTMFIQFISHTGLQKTREILSNRLLYRTYGSDGHGIFFLLKWMIDIFFTRNFSVLLLIFISWIFLKKKKNKLTISFPLKFFIGAMIVLLIYNVIFLGWTAANDFSVMNYVIPFSILSGILVYEVFPAKQMFLILSVFFALCLLEYYYFNRPGNLDRKNRPYNEYKKLGEQIKEIAKPDEIIFINAEPAPQGWYYTRRNYYMVNSFEEAKTDFKRWKQNKCIYINQQNSNIIWYKRMTK